MGLMKWLLPDQCMKTQKNVDFFKSQTTEDLFKLLESQPCNPYQGNKIVLVLLQRLYEKTPK